jgi:hypothetical protein
MPETVGGSGRIAIHGLDPGIPAGMTTQWVLPCVRITPAGTIADDRPPTTDHRPLTTNHLPQTRNPPCPIRITPG